MSTVNIFAAMGSLSEKGITGVLPLNKVIVTVAMRLRKLGPITIGSRVRDTITCVFVPRSVGANSVHLRHETTNRVTA